MILRSETDMMQDREDAEKEICDTCKAIEQGTIGKIEGNNKILKAQERLKYINTLIGD